MREIRDTTGHHHPLPVRQFRWYLLFFHTLTLGSLAGALIWILLNAQDKLSWQELVTSALLVLQAIIYLVFLALGGEWPLPRHRLLLYFGVNLSLWLVEYCLVPQVFWVVFAFSGQMFGMLPAVYGIVTTVLVGGVLYVTSSGWTRVETGIDSPLLIVASVAVLIGFMVYVNHLTRTSQERGQLIAELQAAKRELELAQRREAELAVLRERERLARDLHDSLGHALVTLTVQLEAIQRLYRVDPAAAATQVEAMKALTRSSMDDLRRSLAGLRAPGLGNRELGHAIQAACVDLGQRADLEVSCQIDPAADDLRPALAETLWRVTQEALTNVERHARARTVQVSLSFEPGFVTLRISDDGIGLTPGSQARRNCFGLRGMHERVEGLGGELILDGRAGTVVEASLPLIVSAAEDDR